MANELVALRQAGITVFAVAVSNRAPVGFVRLISSAPRVAYINYFPSPTIPNLNGYYRPLATQVFYITCKLFNIRLYATLCFNYFR